MLEERKKLLVFAEDRDVAEVAAFGLRMHEGWEPVLATTAAQAYKLAHDENVAAIAVIFEKARPAQRSRQQPMPICGNCVHVVVDQALKGIEAARTARIQKGQACRCRDRQPVTVRNNVRDVLRNQAVALSKYLPSGRARVE